MILRLFTISLLLVATLHVQAQTPTDTSTTPAATTTPTVTVAPTTSPPTTTTAPTTTIAPTTPAATTIPPTTQTPITTQTPTTTAPTVTQTPTTVIPTTQTPTTQAPTTIAPTTRAPTTQPPTQQDQLMLPSDQGKLFNTGITALRISGNNNYPLNGTITLRVTVDGTLPGSKILTMSPRVENVLNLPAPATLIPLILGTRSIKGLALDVDDNTAITNVRMYTQQLSNNIYDRITATNTAVGLFAFDHINKKYSYVTTANVESLLKAVSAEIPDSVVGLDSTLVFASYATPPTVTASLATNISIIETLGNLNTTITYADTGLSIRVGSIIGNQLLVEKIYALNEKQEQARRNFGNALVYFKIALNNEEVPHDTLLSYTFTQQELNNAGIPSGSQLRWGYYVEERNIWVQSGNTVDSAGGIVTTNTKHLSTWGVFDTRRGVNAASTTSISFITMIITLIVCMVHLL